MKKIKESEIYPKFTFRLNHKEKEWLSKELISLKNKFATNENSINKNELILAALRHGFRYLKNRAPL
ncbi:MAG: hypothetical protein M9962_06295 [Oligoflexia bacterium]|nr:hypothetical protein [Oligoflexia bacterium]